MTGFPWWNGHCICSSAVRLTEQSVTVGLLKFPPTWECKTARSVLSGLGHTWPAFVTSLARWGTCRCQHSCFRTHHLVTVCGSEIEWKFLSGHEGLKFCIFRLITTKLVFTEYILHARNYAKFFRLFNLLSTINLGQRKDYYFHFQVIQLRLRKVKNFLSSKNWNQNSNLALSDFRVHEIDRIYSSELRFLTCGLVDFQRSPGI